MTEQKEQAQRTFARYNDQKDCMEVFHADQDDIKKEIALANTLRIGKEEWNEDKFDLFEYILESETSNEFLQEEVAEECYIINRAFLPSWADYFFEEFSDISHFSEITTQDIKYLNSEYDIKVNKDDISQILSDIPEIAGDALNNVYDDYDEVIYRWNGSNQERLTVGSSYYHGDYPNDFEDVTEDPDFEDLEIVDKEENTYSIVQLKKNGKTAWLVNISKYQKHILADYFEVDIEDTLEEAKKKWQTH